MKIEVTREDVAGPEESGRYHRQTLLPWWDQGRIGGARVLVVGAGALGCEVLKTLALTGAGSFLVYDMDSIERSNLSRGVLFRDGDVGRPKAEVAARAVRDLNPDVRAVARVENVNLRAGLGVFLWADVVLGCVDNREARVFVNSACARTGRTWVDGAIEGLSGIVRAFDPSRGPCYECTMNETDRRLLAERRSCAMVAREAVALGHVPSTAVAAAIVGGMQAQEALKILHGHAALVGEGIHLDGRWAEWSRVRYPRRADCLGHDSAGTVEPTGMSSAETTLGMLLDRAESELGPGAAIDASRDIVLSLTCPECGDATPGRTVLGAITERAAACPRCGAHRVLDVASSFTREGPAPLDATLADLGFPLYDVVIARRGLDASRAWLLDGDAAGVLGPLAGAAGRS